MLAASAHRSRAASPSPCPAASTAPSPRCSSASAGRRWSAITVKLWADPETDGAKACCSPEAVLGARALAHSLGIPHFTLDLEEEFRRRVVDRFVSGYAEGKTPNPCVLCNGEVRLAAMIDLAERLGAERLLTGHYARIVEDAEGPLLASAADAAKDQSYMLAALPPELLGRLGFPLTELTKPEVREIAARHGLAVARKAESQDLCFLAGQGKRGFLRRHGGLGDREGAVLDRSGRAARPPPRPPQLHRRPAPRDRRLRAGAALRARHRRRRQHGHGRHPRRARNPPRPRSATPSCTATAPASTAVRLRYHSRALPASIGAAAAAAATRRSRSSWARSSPAPRRARPRCCWRARRSSATARSPLA